VQEMTARFVEKKTPNNLETHTPKRNLASPTFARHNAEHF
jgi:hypothetical protein